MISPAEKKKLIDFIKSKGCQPWRDGEECVAQPGKAEVVNGMHDACRQVEWHLRLAERI